MNPALSIVCWRFVEPGYSLGKPWEKLKDGNYRTRGDEKRTNLSASDQIATATILLVSNHFSNIYIFVKTRSKIVCVMYDR